MPRTPRLDWPGTRHHVMNRGARRAPVFTDDDDCGVFLAHLAESSARHGLEVFGYALMSNHFHLLVRSIHGRLSAAMRDLTRGYTQHHNRKHNLDGSLFRGRFRNRVVIDENYWLHLAFYVNHNPVEAGLCADPGEYKWTSYRAMVGAAPCPPWLHASEMIEGHGGLGAYLRYHADHAAGSGRLPDGWEPEQLWSPYTTDRNAGAHHPEPALDSRPGHDALADVARITGVGEDRLLEPVKGRKGNPVRWLAVWWLVYCGGISPRALSRDLRVPASSISRMLARVENERVAGGPMGPLAEALIAQSGRKYPAIRAHDPYSPEAIRRVRRGEKDKG